MNICAEAYILLFLFCGHTTCFRQMFILCSLWMLVSNVFCGHTVQRLFPADVYSLNATEDLNYLLLVTCYIQYIEAIFERGRAKFTKRGY
jgi:hypothetical protein